MSAFEYGLSTQGKQTLIFNNYEYVKHRETNKGIIHWRCRFYFSMKCNSILHTKGEIIVREPSDHNHNVRPYSAQARRLVGNMKKEMNGPGASAKLVKGQTLVGASEGERYNMPKKETLNRVLQRAKRNANHPLLAVPKNKKFPIPENYSGMVLHDTGHEDDNRIIILGHLDLLQLLCENEVWLADGTFKVVPELFYQLYSIHVQMGGMAFACTLALLSSKTEQMYTKMLIIVKGLVLTAKPSIVLIDFEQAAKNAFLREFPGVNVKGCHFHLNQSVIRKIGSLGLKSRYEENVDDFAILVKMMCALSALPVNEVLAGFLEMSEMFPENDHQTEEFLAYFEYTYVRGREKRNGRRGDALFPIEMWNCHDSIVDGIARSTNCVEGFHFSLQSLFQCAHPSMWRFFDGMQKEIAIQHTNYLNVSTGQLNPQKQKYVKLRDRISRIVHNYLDSNRSSDSRKKFLKAIAYCS